MFRSGIKIVVATVLLQQKFISASVFVEGVVFFLGGVYLWVVTCFVLHIALDGWGLYEKRRSYASVKGNYEFLRFFQVR